MITCNYISTHKVADVWIELQFVYFLSVICFYILKVAAGVAIGTTTKSPCDNHIHLSIRREGGFVDPSNYIPQRLIEPPKWEQLCDDYKVVYKVEIETYHLLYRMSWYVAISFLGF
jgi:hypothetical protein